MYHYMIVYDITHIHIYVYTNVHIIHMYLLRVPLCNSPINIHIWFYHKLCKLSYLRCRSVGRSFLHGPESIPEWRTLFFCCPTLSEPLQAEASGKWKERLDALWVAICNFQRTFRWSTHATYSHRNGSQSQCFFSVSLHPLWVSSKSQQSNWAETGNSCILLHPIAWLSPMSPGFHGTKTRVAKTRVAFSLAKTYEKYSEYWPLSTWNWPEAFGSSLPSTRRMNIRSFA